MRFGVLLIACYALVATKWFERLLEPVLLWSARSTGIVLELLGQRVQVTGATLWGEHFAVEVKRGCDPVETWLFLAAAVVAFPVAARDRGLGLLLGAALLIPLNALRLTTLFLAGSLRREYFEFLHVEVWQAAFVIAAVVFWLLWARWSLARLPAAG
ncbi:MAG: archaeosortase/exosortase family protein [Planctomycetota bacterium]